MSIPTVSADIEPQPGQARAAARALRNRGFRVLDIGAWVSVDGPRTLWVQIFGVDFETHARPATEGIASPGSYARPRPGSVQVPADLAGVVKAVSFIEPPEFFAGH